MSEKIPFETYARSVRQKDPKTGVMVEFSDTMVVVSQHHAVNLDAARELGLIAKTAKVVTGEREAA
jgi:hypothetical protein